MERIVSRQGLATAFAMIFLLGCGGGGGGGKSNEGSPPPPPTGSPGSLAPQFGVNGALFSQALCAYGDIVTPLIHENSVYLVGTNRPNSPFAHNDDSARIERYRLDTGALERLFTGFSGIPATAAIDGSGVYVAGDGWRIEKYDLDLSGKIWSSTPTPPVYGVPRSLVLDGDFLFIVGLEQESGTGNNGWWRIEKRKRLTGELVTGFGANGVVKIDPSSKENDEPYAAVLDGEDLYVAGYDRPVLYSQWRVEKVAVTTGENQPFIFSQNASLGDESAMALAVDPESHALFVAGYSQEGSDSSTAKLRWKIGKWNEQGELDTTFGVAGFVWNEKSVKATAMKPMVLTIDAGALYLFGTVFSDDSVLWRMEKRSIQTSAFLDYERLEYRGLEGTSATEIQEGTLATGMLVTSDSILLAGTGIGGNPEGVRGRLEKRMK